MKPIITVLDGRSMHDGQQVHDYLIERFNFPNYYGRNLDALYDLMTMYQSVDPLVILLIFQDDMIESLGDYGLQMIRVFEAAAKVNPFISFRTKEKIGHNVFEGFMYE